MLPKNITAKWIAIVLSVMVLASCSLLGGKDKKEEERDKTRTLTEGQLYQRVQEFLDDKNYDLAVKNLQLLESRFPFGSYAEQAQLEIIYAYLQSGEDDAALASAERFLRLHPDHPDADYAWYMKGLANYALKPGLLARFYQTDYAARDVESARRSFNEFQRFLQRYPESQYAADARVRMIHIKQVLARHEVIVANYFIQRRVYTAAINRARGVVEQYQKTDAVADALAVLAYCYYQMSLPELADESIALLKTNYPEHAAFDASGVFQYGADFNANQRSALNRFSLGLLDAPHAPVFDSRQ